MTTKKRYGLILCTCIAYVLSSEANAFIIHRRTRRISRQQLQQERRPSPGVDERSNRPSQRRSAVSGGRKAATPHGDRIHQDQIQLNRQIVRCVDAHEVLKLLQSKPLGTVACGGSLSTVNFSTALHRLARYSVSPPAARNVNKQQQVVSQRASTLTDPRFALFLASLGEALVIELHSATSIQSSQFTFRFDSRELANIAWAIAKLRISPPQTALAAQSDAASTAAALAFNSQEVRNHVYEAARQRQQSNGATTNQATWVPALARLAGHIMDYTGIYLLDMEQGKHKGRRPFQMQEYSNLLWSFATAGRALPEVCRIILKSMMQRQRQELLTLQENGDTEGIKLLLQPQEWSNSIWSMATAQMESAAATVGDVLEYVSVILVEYPEFGSRFKPQEWSNTVWGVASLLSSQKLREDGLSSQEETAALNILRVAATILLDGQNGIVSTMKSQELTNTIWGFSTLGFGLPSSSALSNINNYIVLKSQTPKEDTTLTSGLVRSIASSALPILHKFRSQELNNLAWALARLVEDSSRDILPELLEKVGRELSNPRRSVTTQDIGTTLWSMATVKFFDEQLYRDILFRLTPAMISEAKPQELSNIVWAVATAEISLGDVDGFDTSLVHKRPTVNDNATRIFGLVAQELMRRPDQFKPQEIKDVLWSFSRVGIRFPALFRITAEYLVGGVETDARYTEGRGLSGFSTQGLANLVWAFARQAQLAEDVPTRQGKSRLASGNGRLVVYTTSFLDIGEKLLQKLLKTVAETSISDHDNLRKLKPLDLCLTAWAFAVVGLKHSRFIDAARNEVQRRLEENMSGRTNLMNTFRGQEIANFLWSMGTVHADPGDLPERLSAYIMRSLQESNGDITAKSIASMFQRQELANIAWSCAVFWRFPEPLMRLLYGGLVGTGDEQAPDILISAHGDAGLQPQAAMTLIYVQTAMCLEGPRDRLSLPRDFPSGWQESSPSKSLDHTTDSMLELKLSTSRIQRAVSASLHRVGFEHVEEHVITMHDLLHVYGVDVPDSPTEALSIDMANVEQRIAIEFDGPAHYINEIDFDTEIQAGFSTAINGKFEYQFRWNGDRQEMNGSTYLKQTLLTLLGWKVVNIPFWQWYSLEKNEAAEDAYCKTILENVNK